LMLRNLWGWLWSIIWPFRIQLIHDNRLMKRMVTIVLSQPVTTLIRFNILEFLDFLLYYGKDWHPQKLICLFDFSLITAYALEAFLLGDMIWSVMHKHFALCVQLLLNLFSTFSYSVTTCGDCEVDSLTG
jgi:hypothetical protein